MLGVPSKRGERVTQHLGYQYDDGVVACTPDGLLIRRYYPWGSKLVHYHDINSVDVLPLTGPDALRRWRIWGSNDFVHWWNLDLRRTHKDTALMIDVDGKRVRPTITPDDPMTVRAILTQQASL